MSVEDNGTIKINLSKSGNKSLVKKGNKLNEARYKSTLMGQRIVLSIISQIRMEDEDLKTYRLNIQDFANFFKLKQKSIYKDFSETVDRLQTSLIIIPEGDKEHKYNWFAKTTHDKEGGYVDFEFHPDLKPYLIQLRESFVRYGLTHIVKLKSNHSIRVYELLKQYENLGARSFKIEHLKEILGLKNEYERWDDFKRWVINKARNEINEKTDIVIGYKTIRKGRKIAEVKFTVHSSDIESKEKRINELLKLVKEDHRNEKMVKKLISYWYNEKTFSYVRYNILYTNKQKTKNYIGYFTDSLKHNWGTEIEIDEREERLRKEKEMYIG